MLDSRLARMEGEIALAAFGVSPGAFGSWVFDRLTNLVDPHFVKVGDVLWKRGEPLEFLFFMRQGRVQALRQDGSPWTFEGRWLLGAFEGHRNRHASRTLVALEDFPVLKIQRRGWLELLEDSAEMARRAVVNAAGTVARLEERSPARPAGLQPPLRQHHGDRPLTLVERVAFLMGLPIASGVGVQALANIASASEEISVGAGQSLDQEKVVKDRLLFVVDGDVHASRSDPDVERRYRPGDLVGEAAALCERVRDWTAKALTPARLLAISQEAWLDAMEEHFEIAEAALLMLAVERESILDELSRAAGPGGITLT